MNGLVGFKWFNYNECKHFAKTKLLNYSCKANLNLDAVINFLVGEFYLNSDIPKVWWWLLGLPPSKHPIHDYLKLV
jgi:hypothetical protein